MPNNPTVIRRICAGFAMASFFMASILKAQTTPPPPSEPAAQDTSLPQGPTKTDVHIEQTDLLHFAKFGPDSVQIRKLIGNVKLRQDSTIIYCDSAMQFIDTALIVARGHVVITMEGGKVIKAEELDYRGDVKILDLKRNVSLADSAVTLYTERLTYFKEPNYGEYTTGGRLVSKENVLTSKKGYYHPDQKMAYFRDDVKLTNPDYTLTTDTLGYNTDTRIAFFLAPTLVKDSLNTMYTEDGYYDTQNDFAYLHTNAYVGDETYTLFADTIQYDQKADLGKAIGHVIAEQKDSTLTVYGKYALFKSKTESTYVTDSTFAVQMSKGDTLYLLADTLQTFTDTTTDKRFFYAHPRANIYSADLQGICDSLAYWYDDSIMVMYKDPVLWSDKSQLTGDTIGIGMKNGGIDTMYIPSRPMLASQEDTVGYNQIKGDLLLAKFDGRHVLRMYINGSAQSIYYTQDDKERYIGMNSARCADMYITFKDNKPSRILFDKQPEGTFYPLHTLTEDKKSLEGFMWRENQRPTLPLWCAERVRMRYGPVDTFALSLDSINRILENAETALASFLMDSATEASEDSLEGGSQPIDTLSMPIDTLGNIGVIDTAGTLAQNDPVVRDTGSRANLKGMGSQPESGNIYDFNGAGNRRLPPAAEKRSFKQRIKAMFAKPEDKDAARLAKRTARIKKKADKEEMGRYAKVEKRQRKAIKAVPEEKVEFNTPRINSRLEKGRPPFEK